MIAVRAGDVAVFAATVTAVLFIALYWRTARWWRSEWGWRMMLGQIGWAVLLVNGSVAVFTRTDPPPNALLRLVGALIVVAAQVWSLTLLARAQLAAHRERKADR